tara:strand:- start:19138 stop:19395 length:258 start_codon:yes stop_codon:yes gene_type:complete
MALKDQKEITELYILKHQHDRYPRGFNYFNQILKKSLSPFMYQNNNMNGFLLRLEPLIAQFFDRMNIIRNWRNWSVDKYKNDHVK